LRRKLPRKGASFLLGRFLMAGHLALVLKITPIFEDIPGRETDAKSAPERD
jgi:hypothetical protein